MAVTGGDPGGFQGLLRTTDAAGAGMLDAALLGTIRSLA